MLTQRSFARGSVRTCAAPTPQLRGSDRLTAALASSRLAPRPLPEPVIAAWRRSTEALVDRAINQPSIHSASGVRIHLVGIRHNEVVSAAHVMRVLDAVQPDVVCLELRPGMHKPAKAVARRLSATVAKLSRVRDPEDTFTVISEAQQAQWNHAARKIRRALPPSSNTIACGGLQYAEFLSSLAWASEHRARVDSIDDDFGDREDAVHAACGVLFTNGLSCMKEALRIREEHEFCSAEWDETQRVLEWWEDAMCSSMSSAEAHFCLSVFSKLLLPEDNEACAALHRAACPNEYALVIDERDAVMAQRLRPLCSREGRYRSWAPARSVVVVVGIAHVPGLKKQLMTVTP